MAWALYLSNTSESSVTHAQLAELDDYELACRAGPTVSRDLLHRRIGPILHALVCVAGAQNSRAQMLRSVNLLHSILDPASPSLLHKAVCSLAQLHIQSISSPSNSSSTTTSSLSTLQHSQQPTFLHPLVSIAVNRVADVQLSATAADACAILLGCPALDPSAHDPVPLPVCHAAETQTRRLLAMLLTELALTDSARALSALAKLLRRDGARVIFCEKDGVSVLASALHVLPSTHHLDDDVRDRLTIAAVNASNGRCPADTHPVYAAYHAIFAVWMLTFATTHTVQQLVLHHLVASRLIVTLARLLRHASGQRLKIARVTLATLSNLSRGESALHRRVRRDLLAADVPSALKRLLHLTSVRGSLMGTDDDAREDAQSLLDLLDRERATMSTLDAYIAEVRAGALHWSPVHKDTLFWTQHVEKLVTEFPDVVNDVANVVLTKDASVEEQVIACSDLANIIRLSSGGRRLALTKEGLKLRLMHLMTEAKQQELKSAALVCVQLLLLHRSLRQA